MNFFSFAIFVIIIISNKFFLFNEEFLILLSFLVFCFVTYTKLNTEVSLKFQNKTLDLEQSFLVSLNLLSAKLLEKKILNNNFLTFKLLFTSLKNYYLNFISHFLINFLNYINYKQKTNFSTKLVVFSVLEKDYFQFIIFLLLKKLNQINLILAYFNSIIKIKKFQTIIKINRLNLIKKI
uniref:ATP synthase F0 subunit b n=1 Tax=Erythrocystis saccata TaxID=2822695 RepID=A0A8E6L2U9_9FLOR|nr:ATP synthase F0 subunit b [Erythrocystis saccata]